MGDSFPEKSKEHAVLKKMGMVGVGVTAGLLAAAPFASATECPDAGHGGHDNFNSSCAFKGGDAATAADISGDAGLAGNVVSQLPVAGNNIGNIADCSSFLNNNLNGNLSGNNVALLGSNLEPSHVVNSHKLESHKLDSAKSSFASHKVDTKKVDSHKLDAKKVSTEKAHTYKLNGKSASPSSMLSF